MVIINVCKFENVKLELVFTLKAIFFFRLQTIDASYNYRNPIKCINEVLKRIQNDTIPTM